VGAVTFHVGVSSKLVIEAAQRQYLRSQTPEEVKERLLKREAFLKAINEGIGDDNL
jgi:sensor histidine kinase regulating citrate/malate metabolism